MRVFYCLLIVTTAAVLSAGAAPNEKQIADLYRRALAGDTRAVAECIAGLEQLLASRPNDQLTRVYLGSACTLRSRELAFGLEKLRALHRGDALMDEAAAAAPNDARVQLLRAVTYEAFPAVLGRGETARQALDDLVAQLGKNPHALSPADQQLLYLNAGEAAQKTGDEARATKLWEHGFAIRADESLRRELAAALARR